MSINDQMVIQMTCVQPNFHSAIHTQTQMQTETEGYRMHFLNPCLEKETKDSLEMFICKRRM